MTSKNLSSSRIPVSPSSYSRSSRPRLRFSSRSCCVGELLVRVPVEPLHPAVRRRAVDGPPVLLGVLAVVALAVGQPEQPLLEDRVLAVPQRDPEVDEAVPVADPAEPVLTPAVGPGVGLIERERRPGVAVGRVVLPDRAPLPAGEVRAPEPPRDCRGCGTPPAGRARRTAAMAQAMAPTPDRWPAARSRWVPGPSPAKLATTVVSVALPDCSPVIGARRRGRTPRQK